MAAPLTARRAAAFAAGAHYRSAPGDARRPALLLHGLGGDSGQLWAEAASYPGRRWAPDLRAHGQTDIIGGDECFTFEQLATDVVQLLKRLESEPVLVVGVSMGAGAALTLAGLYPDQVRGLLLIRPAWDNQLPPANLVPLLQAGHYLQRWGPVAGRSMFAGTAEYAAVAAQSAAAAASLLGQFDGADAQARSARLRRLPLSRPWRAETELAAIAVPTEVIGARDDPVHPLAVAKNWASRIPSATMSTLPSRDLDPAGYAADLRSTVSAFLNRWG